MLCQVWPKNAKHNQNAIPGWGQLRPPAFVLLMYSSGFCPVLSPCCRNKQIQTRQSGYGYQRRINSTGAVRKPSVGFGP